MKNTLKHILLVLLLLLPISIYAQSYTFRGVTMAEGLSDLLVNSIYKDSEGFVWLGTDNCLDRFDGVKIKHYPFPTADVKRKRVNVVLQTAVQELWVGNGLGLWQLNKSTDQMMQVAPGEINFTVYSLFVDSKNMRYVGTEKGL
ncbi:MAG: transcriptional regulator, partial [Parabacteroides sp.]|nr:transcriptional regulator [Parabacteroides sp.]